VRVTGAVIGGFLTTSVHSIVKLAVSQHDLFTTAQLLSKQQYSTLFIYGDEADFDNRKRFSHRIDLTISLMKMIMATQTSMVLGRV
jgi:phosphoglycerol transferase MdoB-like AlkP superfamily enzyme